MAESAAKSRSVTSDAAVVILGLLVLVVGLWMVVVIVTSKLDGMQTRIGLLEESIKGVSMQIVELQNHVLDEKMAAPATPAPSGPQAMTAPAGKTQPAKR